MYPNDEEGIWVVFGLSQRGNEISRNLFFRKVESAALPGEDIKCIPLNKLKAFVNELNKKKSLDVHRSWKISDSSDHQLHCKRELRAGKVDSQALPLNMAGASFFPSPSPLVDFKLKIFLSTSLLVKYGNQSLPSRNVSRFYWVITFHL